MSTKIVYFVRHGESELNARGIRQGPDGPLSEHGRDQIRKVADSFVTESKKMQVLISSPFQRTKESAEIISKKLNLPIEFSDLLVERKNPSEIVGHSRAEEKVKNIVDRIDKGFHSDDLRYSDEENFVDLKTRAKKLLEFISKRKEKRLVMVTHGIFLTMVAAYIADGDELTADAYTSMSYLNTLDNAGVVICSYTTYWFKKNEWNMLVWNAIPVSQFKPHI